MSRKQPVFKTRKEYNRKLKSFGAVHCHQRDLACTLFHFIRIAVRRNLLKKFFQARRFVCLRLLLFVIVNKRFKVHEVLDSSLCLKRVFTFEGFHIACPNKEVVVDIRNP